MPETLPYAFGLLVMEFEFGYNDVNVGGGVGQFQELKVASCFRGEEYGISSVAFDPQEDLLWAATYGVSCVGHSYG